MDSQLLETPICVAGRSDGYFPGGSISELGMPPARGTGTWVLLTTTTIRMGEHGA